MVDNNSIASFVNSEYKLPSSNLKKNANSAVLCEPHNTTQNRSLRFVALCSVAFSTVSVLACVITLPIVYHHAQNIYSYMQNEVDFCKVK